MTIAKASAEQKTIVICASDAPRDQKYARRLARDIKRMGYRPLFRRRKPSLPAADINQALMVLVVLSPQLASCAAAHQEYRYAVEQEKRVYPLRTEADDRMPAELESIQWMEFSVLYEDGLAKLVETLGLPVEKARRRAARAARKSKIIPVVRTILAAFMLAMILLLIATIFGIGTALVAVLPLLFIEAAEEDYRRGDNLGLRIALAKILVGCAAGALVGVLLFPQVLTASNGSLATTLTLVVVLGAVLVPAGGFVVWFASWLERRSLRRGNLALHRLLSYVRFFADGALILAALLSAGLSNAAPLVVVALVAVTAFVSGELQWLQSPLHRVRRARFQSAEVGKASSQVAPIPSSAKLTFISHSSADNDFAIRLSRDLQRYGIVTWVDRRRLVPGMSWPDEIQRSLDGSHLVLVVLSEVAVKSDWVRMEYQTAISHDKEVLVLRLEATCPLPLELAQARVIDFATLYESGLAEVLAALHAEPQAVAEARQSTRQRLRNAWLISAVRMVSSTYLLLARVLIFGVASFMLLGGFEHLDGIHSLSAYAVIWVARALPGVALGILVGLEERARVAGVKLGRWMSILRSLDGGLTGDSLIGVWTLGIFGLAVAPLTWLAIGFFSNVSPWVLVNTWLAQPSSLTTADASYVALLVGLAVANAMLAIPLERWQKRSHEEGRRTLAILSYIALFSVRVGIGSMGVIIPAYLLLGSPVDPLGPPQSSTGITGTLILSALTIGVAVAAVDLFFFPTRPSRKALRSLQETVVAQWA